MGVPLMTYRSVVQLNLVKDSLKQAGVTKALVKTLHTNLHKTGATQSWTEA